jgi:hypothetical protein
MFRVFTAVGAAGAVVQTSTGNSGNEGDASDVEVFRQLNIELSINVQYTCN